MHVWQKQRVAMDAAILVGVFAGLCACFAFIAFNAPIGDEWVHTQQIEGFIAGRYQLHGAITQLPGYHAVIALLAVITGRHSLFAMRLFSFAIGMLSIPLFYLLAHRRYPEHAAVRTVQYAFLPIVLPFFFLVYTDVLSLVFVLLAMLALEKRAMVLAALIAGCAMLVRQTNIVWALFLWAISLAEMGGSYLALYWPHHAPWKGFSITWWWKQETVQEWLKKSWPFFVLYALFAVFLYVNKGVAVGDKSAHPFPAFHPGNVYFALFLSFFLLLPIHIANLPAVIRSLSSWRGVWAVAGLAVFALIFFGTFENTHPSNQAEFVFFLRNRLLVLFSTIPAWKIFFFSLCALSLIFLCFLRLRPGWMYLLYPATFLFLVLAWLIEQRYYLIPLTLLLAYREKSHIAIEIVMALAYIAGALLLFQGVVRGEYFL